MPRTLYRDRAGREIEAGDYVKATEPGKGKQEPGHTVIGRVQCVELDEDKKVFVRVVHPHLPGGVLDAFYAAPAACEIVLKSDGSELEPVATVAAAAPN